MLYPTPDLSVLHETIPPPPLHYSKAPPRGSPFIPHQAFLVNQSREGYVVSSSAGRMVTDMTTETIETVVPDGLTEPDPQWERKYMNGPNMDFVEDIEGYEPGGFHPVLLDGTLNDVFEVVHKLGFGGMATVWLCMDHLKKEWCAVKIVAASCSAEDGLGPEGDKTLPRKRHQSGASGCKRCSPTERAFLGRWSKW